MAGSLQPQLMSVQDLFSMCLFQVPNYQRAYAWEENQWEDLWEDILEGMRTQTTHFLGTVVLMAQEGPHYDSEGRSLRKFQLVDGQQRVTTLCLLLLTAYDQARVNQQGVAKGLWRDFIEHETNLEKLCLGNLNARYFSQLIADVRHGRQLPTDPNQRSTNSRLRGAVCRFQDLLNGWLQVRNGDVGDLASYVREQLQVLRFVTDSQSLAIKAFQSVNDRGKKLSLLDKTKSFLMFYITRYLHDDARVFQIVEERFGRVFDNCDAVKDLARRFGVNYLVSPQFRFNEDEFLRYAYHYGVRDISSSFNLPFGYEYGITPEQVFDVFVKGACRDLRERPSMLKKFIVGWCKNLDKVSQALVDLLKCIPENPSCDHFFRFQGPNASVYPLLVTAKARGILDDEMLNAIAVLDLRVYQVRGTDPKADLYRYAVSEMKTGERNNIYNAIVEFCQEFGADQTLDTILRGPVYRQSFTKYVLWQHAVKDENETDQLDHELYADCQVDHVLPHNPSTFDVTTFGFDTDEEYEATKHGFGNLAVLESNLNEQAQNAPPGNKARFYERSAVRSNRVLGTRFAAEGFTRQDQVNRSNEIVQFFKQEWPIPPEI